MQLNSASTHRSHLLTKTHVNCHKSPSYSSAHAKYFSPGAPDFSKASNCIVCTANSATSNWRPKLPACWYKPLSCCSSKHGYQTMTLAHGNLTNNTLLLPNVPLSNTFASYTISISLHLSCCPSKLPEAHFELKCCAAWPVMGCMCHQMQTPSLGL